MKKLLTLMFLISSPVFAEDFILVCKWKSGDHQAVKVYGEGVHTDRGWRITETQEGPWIGQTIDVFKVGTEELSRESFFWLIDRYTGRLEYTKGDQRRLAQCRKADKPLF